MHGPRSHGVPGYVERHDRWGNIRLIKVCDVY